MVIAELGETISTIRDILVIVTPIVLLILLYLVRKGIVSRETAEKAEKVIRVLTGSVEAFKDEDRPKSRQLTELIDAKARGEKVAPELKAYLDKFNLNQR